MFSPLPKSGRDVALELQSLRRVEEKPQSGRMLDFLALLQTKFAVGLADNDLVSAFRKKNCFEVGITGTGSYRG